MNTLTVPRWIVEHRARLRLEHARIRLRSVERFSPRTFGVCAVVVVTLMIAASTV